MTTLGNELHATTATVMGARSVWGRALDALLVGSVLLGCQQLEALDLHNFGNVDSTGGASSEAPAVATPEPIASSTCADFVGTWLGEAGDTFGAPDASGRLPLYRFPSGSTELRLVLKPLGADRVALDGSALTFGSGGPYPPATDPLAPCPNTQYLEYARLGLWTHPPLEGFAYTLIQVHSQIDRLQTSCAPPSIPRHEPRTGGQHQRRSMATA